MWRSVSWLLNSKFMLCLLTSNVIILWLLSEDSSHVFLDKYYQKKTNCKRKRKSKRTALPRRRSLGFLTPALVVFHTWPGALRIGARNKALMSSIWEQIELTSMCTEFRNHRYKILGKRNTIQQWKLNSVVLYKKNNRKVCQNGDKVKRFKQIEN